MTELNERERDVLRHTLTGGTKLVERGLMEKRERLFYDGWVYRATAAGAEAAGLELP